MGLRFRCCTDSRECRRVHVRVGVCETRVPSLGTVGMLFTVKFSKRARESMHSFLQHVIAGYPADAATSLLVLRLKRHYDIQNCHKSHRFTATAMEVLCAPQTRQTAQHAQMTAYCKLLPYSNRVMQHPAHVDADFTVFQS